MSCCFDFYLFLYPVGWGYCVGFFWGIEHCFFWGSNSDDKLVPSAEMLGRMTLTFGWWYRVGFFGESYSDDKLECVFVLF